MVVARSARARRRTAAPAPAGRGTDAIGRGWGDTVVTAAAVIVAAPNPVRTGSAGIAPLVQSSDTALTVLTYATLFS